MTPAAPHDHTLQLPSGRTLRLMPERAAWCMDTATLFAADLHLGKAAVFRARGVPVPRGTTQGTLARLSSTLARSGAKRLVVLGDLLHARESHAPATLKTLRDWRARHARIEIVHVEGNHDVHAGSLPADLGMPRLDGVFRDHGLVGVHRPSDLRGNGSGPAAWPDDELVLAGHLHPVVLLRSRLDQLRLPCFWLQPEALPGRPGLPMLTLPAFGEFTGGWPVPPDTGCVFAVADQAVLDTAPPSRGRPKPERSL